MVEFWLLGRPWRCRAPAVTRGTWLQAARVPQFVCGECRRWRSLCGLARLCMLSLCTSTHRASPQTHLLAIGQASSRPAAMDTPMEGAEEQVCHHKACARLAAAPMGPCRTDRAAHLPAGASLCSGAHRPGSQAPPSGHPAAGDASSSVQQHAAAPPAAQGCSLHSAVSLPPPPPAAALADRRSPFAPPIATGQRGAHHLRVQPEREGQAGWCVVGAV